MPITHRLRRSATLGAIVCAAVVPATPGVAGAVPDPLAQERYYSSYGDPQPIDARTAAARAQERYYSSYGETEQLTLPQSPVPSDDTPWLPIALSLTGALIIVTASATRLRWLRLRRGPAVRSTA